MQTLAAEQLQAHSSSSGTVGEWVHMQQLHPVVLACNSHSQSVARCVPAMHTARAAGRSVGRLTGSCGVSCTHRSVVGGAARTGSTAFCLACPFDLSSAAALAALLRSPRR